MENTSTTKEQFIARAAAAKAEEAARRQNIRIKFDAKLLRLLAPFVAVNDMRHHINGLRVERATDKNKGIYLVATDGCRLAAYYDPDGMIVADDGKGAVIRLPRAMLAAAKAPRHRDMKLIVRGMRASIATDFGGDAHDDAVNETYIMPGNPYVDGTFPNWRNVMPVFESLASHVTVDVNPNLLVSFAGLCSKYTGMKLWQSEGSITGQLVVQLPEHPNFVGLLMPMRLDANKEAMKPVFDACKPKQ